MFESHTRPRQSSNTNAARDNFHRIFFGPTDQVKKSSQIFFGESREREKGEEEEEEKEKDLETAERIRSGGTRQQHEKAAGQGKNRLGSSAAAAADGGATFSRSLALRTNQQKKKNCQSEVRK